MLGVRGIEDGDGVGLVEAREKEKVGVLTERKMDVVVAANLLRTRNDGDAVAERLGEALPSLDERPLTVSHRSQGNTS